MKLMIDVSKSFSPRNNDIFVYDTVKGWKVVNKCVYEATIDKKLVKLEQLVNEKEAVLNNKIKELDGKIEKAKVSIVKLANLMEE